jgi:hypothetical protein
MRTMWQMTMAVAAVVLAVAGGKADEEKVPLDKLPKAVTDAVKKRFPKAEVKEAAKETEGGKTEYEVSLKDGETEIDVMLTPEGTITLIEKTVPMKGVPKKVADAVAAKAPKGKVRKAEEVIRVTDGKETLAYYEFLVEVDGKTEEVEVLPDGMLKPEEKKEEKKKDK